MKLAGVGWFYSWLVIADSWLVIVDSWLVIVDSWLVAKLVVV